MTSRGTCLDVPSVPFRPVDGRGTQCVVQHPGTDITATGGYVDTGIRCRGCKRTDDGTHSGSDAAVGVGGEDRRDRVQFLSWLRDVSCCAAKPSGAGLGSHAGPATDPQEFMSGPSSGVRATVPVTVPPSSHSLHAADAVPSAPRVSTVLPSIVSGCSDQGRSGQHCSTDGRRSVHRARKSPERIVCESIQQLLSG